MHVSVVLIASSVVALLTTAPAGASHQTVAAPPAAQPRVDTPQSHGHEDHVHHDALSESRLRRHTQESTVVLAAAAAEATAGLPQEVGQWGALTPWPVVAIHTALLPDGKVLSYDSVGDRATESFAAHDFTRATVWDPATGTHTAVLVDTGYNLFCSGLAHLPDGSVFLAGGNKNSSLQGIAQTHVFSYGPYAWNLGSAMAFERWYPSTTPLPSGEMLITEGYPDTPEVRNTNGTFRSLAGANLDLPLYPWLDAAPDGRAFYSGPDDRMLALTTSGAGSWQSLGAGDGRRDYGSRAVYDVGRILVAGGAASRRDAAVLDLNGSTPRRTVTGSMAFGRRQHNLTMLADGSVLATGGNSSGAGLVDLASGVYAAERWDPTTGTWTTMSAQRQTRQYHSTALLLPDGRVLSAGGGICGTCDDVGYLAKDAEVFTPPYLFDGAGNLAARPTVSSAPSTVVTGSSFAVSTPQAGAIRKVGLVRLGGVTHSTEMEQRYIPLTFTAGSGALTVTAPRSASIAPPGPYMLFVTDDRGVPSVASMTSVQVAPNAAPSVLMTSPTSGASVLRKEGISVVAEASDPDGAINKVEFLRGDSTVLGQDTSAPYSYVWRNPQVGEHVLRVRATDDRGAATTSAAATVTVRR